MYQPIHILSFPYKFQLFFFVELFGNLELDLIKGRFNDGNNVNG